MEEVRGKAHNPGRYKQLVDYSKLCWGKITPTDIDGAIDFGGRLFILIDSALRLYAPDLSYPDLPCLTHEAEAIV